MSSNYGQDIAFAIGERGGNAVMLDARGIVSNSRFDLIGYTATPNAPRDDIIYPGSVDGFQVASTDSNDTGGGSGAHSVFISYLSPDGELKFETVELSGMTPVDLPQAHRYLDIRIEEGGDIASPRDDKSAGVISIGKDFTAGTPSEVYLQMNPLTGCSNTGAFTIPANHRGKFQVLFASGPKNDEIEFLLFNRMTGKQWNAPAGTFSADNNNLGGFIASAFQSMQDIELRAKSVSGPAMVHVVFNAICVPVSAS